jgi:hypothetical protein
MRTVIRNKPPEPGATYEDPQEIELFDENGEPTGIYMLRTAHTPNPVVTCPDLRIVLVEATTIEISWQAPSPCVLYMARDLNPPIVWTPVPVPGPYPVIGGRYTVLIDIQQQQQTFYQLSFP